MIKKLKTTLVYEDPWLKFYQDEIVLPDGKKSTYSWMDRKNGVGVVVMNKDKKILLQREFRYVIQKPSWEIQGGGIEKGQTKEEAAIMELEEEAGIKATKDSLMYLGKYYPIHSVSTETIDLFLLITDTHEVHRMNIEIGEMIDEHDFFTFEQVYTMIDDGSINDVYTAFAVQLAIRKCGL